MSDSTHNIVRQFYQAFQEGNAQAMNLAYHKNVSFHDPVFGDLDLEHTTAMWNMLCSSKQSPTIDFEILTTTDKEALVRWEAHYHFGKKKRLVHNIISTRMIIEEQKIRYHYDSFKLYRWARQAFGWQGVLFGWTSFFKKKLRKSSSEHLQRYMNKQSA